MSQKKKKKKIQKENQTCPLNSLKYLLLLFGHCETGEIPVGLKTSDLIVLSGHRPSPEAPQQNCLIQEKAEELNSDPIPSPKLKMMKKRSHHFTKIPRLTTLLRCLVEAMQTRTIKNNNNWINRQNLWSIYCVTKLHVFNICAQPSA